MYLTRILLIVFFSGQVTASSLLQRGKCKAFSPDIKKVAEKVSQKEALLTRLVGKLDDIDKNHIKDCTRDNLSAQLQMVLAENSKLQEDSIGPPIRDILTRIDGDKIQRTSSRLSFSLKKMESKRLKRSKKSKEPKESERKRGNVPLTPKQCERFGREIQNVTKKIAKLQEQATEMQNNLNKIVKNPASGCKLENIRTQLQKVLHDNSALQVDEISVPIGTLLNELEGSEDSGEQATSQVSTDAAAGTPTGKSEASPVLTELPDIFGYIKRIFRESYESFGDEYQYPFLKGAREDVVAVLDYDSYCKYQQDDFCQEVLADCKHILLEELPQWYYLRHVFVEKKFDYFCMDGAISQAKPYYVPFMSMALIL